MAVKINAESGSTIANSFVVMDMAEEFFNQSLDYGEWNGLSADDQARYLIAATNVINSLRLKPLLEPSLPYQSLKFPLLGEEGVNNPLPIQDMVIENPATLQEVAYTTDSETGIVSFEITVGSYNNDSNVVVPDDWTASGTVYTHTPGIESKIEVVLDQTKIEDGDILGFIVEIANSTAGSIETSIGTLSAINNIISGNTEHSFDLEADNIDKIFFKATADFDGDFSITSIKQADAKYEKVIGIDGSSYLYFGIGEQYEMFLSEMTGAVSIYEGDNKIAGVTQGDLPYSIKRTNTAETLWIYNTGMQDEIVQFKIDHVLHAQSIRAAQQATMLQAMWMIKNADVIALAMESEITGYNKEGYGHGSNEKTIISMNPFKKYAPGVFNLMSTWVEIGLRVGRY